jgi:hypothetical protein
VIPKTIRNQISSLVMRLSGSDKKIQYLENQVDQMNSSIFELSAEIGNQTQHTFALLNARENRLHEYVKSALALAATNVNEAKVITSESEGGELGAFFDLFGSDKNSRHSYANVYEQILSKNESPRILEIGLGSLNAFPYAGGQRPGSSLNAWRKKYPTSFLVGADIDPESVETVSEIAFVVDQTDSVSLDALSSKLTIHGQFDLIIDDGFHDPHANIQTLIKLLPHLTEDGTYIIEDVHSSLINFWRLVIEAMGLNGEVLDMSPLRPKTDDNVLIAIKRA